MLSAKKKVSKQTWSSSWLSSLEASTSSPVASELIVAFPKPLEPPRSAPTFSLPLSWGTSDVWHVSMVRCVLSFEVNLFVLIAYQFCGTGGRCCDIWAGHIWSGLWYPQCYALVLWQDRYWFTIWIMEMEFMVFTLYEQRFSLRKARLRWVISQQLYAHQI